MPKRILLADDSITIQKVVELTFSDGDYEVTAVNNGTKAIQKLAEMRPDIILSDIIMPEKNGYEVCEYVKSHPEYRAIPVVLLTGTFEPFDPDRADKAGCDAVVTKPFESQSLIHKVEELIAGSQAQAPAEAPAPPPAAPAPEPPPPAAPEPSPFATSAFQAQSSDIFGAPSATTSPFEESAPASGETKAFPRMSFDELQQMANQPSAAAPPPPPPPPAPMETSPWDETPAATGETKAFPKMSFEDLQPPAAPAPQGSPWDEAPAAGAAPEASPWEQAPPPPAPAPEPESPWGEPAGVTGGETRAIPKMSFEELQQAASTPVAEEVPFAPSAAPAPSGAPAPSPAPFAAEESAFAAEGGGAPLAEGGGAPLAEGGGAPLDLTEEQIDRIARRVVQLISQDVVKNIAWEVIPDMAEMVVKERIRQLEGEA